MLASIKTSVYIQRVSSADVTFCVCVFSFENFMKLRTKGTIFDPKMCQKG